MKLRKMFLLFIAVVSLSGATLGAALAAPRGQEAPSGAADGAGGPGRDVAAQHRPDNKPARAILGLVTKPMNDHERNVLGFPEEFDGLLVMRTLPESPAEEAGLMRGDVVLTAAGDPVTTSRELHAIVSGMSPGDEIEVVYWRDGETQPAVGIFLGDQTGRDQPRLPAWLTQLHRLTRTLPNVVDGELRVLNGDGGVSLYEVTPGTVATTTSDTLTLLNRLDVEITFSLTGDSVVINGRHRIELGELREGANVVVLEIDGVVKAIVVSGQRADGDRERNRPNGIDDARPNPHREIVRDFQDRMKELREEFRGRQDDVSEGIEKLRDRIHDLQERFGDINDVPDDSDNDPDDISGETIAA
jgi:hypothetical protein